MSSGLDITTSERDGITLVSLDGVLDGHTFVGLEAHLNDLLDTAVTYMVVDLAGLTYIASAGVGVLINVLQQLQERGGSLVAARPGPVVSEVFDILGLETLMPIRSDLDEAFATLGETS